VTPEAVSLSSHRVASQGASVSLRYLKQGAIIVRGPETGRQYAFNAARSVQAVDAKDATGLLRTSWFRRA
jgi:hypothetical protein